MGEFQAGLKVQWLHLRAQNNHTSLEQLIGTRKCGIEALLALFMAYQTC